jgi:hypothetical protein
MELRAIGIILSMIASGYNDILAAAPQQRKMNVA